MTPVSRASPVIASRVTIREHRIPSADSKPYIATQGPDGRLWFCESGAGKIGAFDADRGAFAEFALPRRNATPIGIITGGDGNLWFADYNGESVGRITTSGVITLFPTSGHLLRITSGPSSSR